MGGGVTFDWDLGLLRDVWLRCFLHYLHTAVPGLCVILAFLHFVVVVET